VKFFLINKINFSRLLINLLIDLSIKKSHETII